MSFFRQLAVRLFGALLVPMVLAWYVSVAFFPFTPAQREAAQLGAALGLLGVLVLGTLALVGLVGTVRRGLEAPADASGALSRSRAVVSALRLPGRVAVVLLFLSATLVATVVLLELRQGLPSDLALAAVAAGGALGIMAAMLGYSVTASSLAPVIAELGSFELRERGTVRGKILVVCFGLVGMTAILVGAVAYARYRADADRHALEIAVQAQERAARWVSSRGPAAAAELVWLSSGAPTAVVAPDGSVLARAGEGDALALGGGVGGAGLPAAGPAVERLAGGWRLRRAAGPLTLVSYLPEAPLRDRREAFWGAASLLGLALLGAAGLLVWLAAKSLTTPLTLLGRAAKRIAAGDLTAVPPSVSRDEMGQLAADFRRMAHELRALVTDVQEASVGVGDGTREMGAIGERVEGGAREEHERAVAVKVAVEAMQDSVALVGRGVGELTDYVQTTSSSVGEMAAALEEVRRQAAELERRMETAGADVERLAGAGRRAQTQLGALDALAGHAQGTLATVSASLSGLETAAISSQLAAAQAAEMAEQAGGVVQQNVDGMASLRGAVGDAKKRVTALGRRSDDIDQILDFIGEVAGRTNLLSLNASIIATQAGEHGKAFGVVADQIRELAAQISSSTKSIGEIIRAVRDDVAGTARLIDRGDDLASSGLEHARKSLAALGEIRAATAKGHESAAGIRQAVQAHAHSTRDVSDLVASVAGNSHTLAEAVEMVGTSVGAVGAVSRGAQALADKVSRALEEQSGLGRRQLEGLDKINAMLSDITRAVENHDAATRRVREVLGQLTRTAERHRAVVIELSGVADRLGGRSRALAERVGRFKIELRGDGSEPR